jgi:hypothetical protein
VTSGAYGQPQKKLLTYKMNFDILNLVDKEEYPSLAEGIGLENRQGCQSPRGFESLLLRHILKYPAHKMEIGLIRYIT